MDEVEISGRRYIKASIVAKKMGYTADYVGQLCRAGKIEGKRVGRTWYVNADTVVAHRSENARSNRQKTIEQIDRGRISEVTKPAYVSHDARRPMPTYRKQILSVPIRYEKDEHPLFPETTKSFERKLVPTATEEEEEETWSATVDLTASKDNDGYEEEQEEHKEREVLLSGTIPVALAPDTEEIEIASITDLGKENGESTFLERLQEVREQDASQPVRQSQASQNNRQLPAKRPVFAIVPVTTVVLGLVLTVGGVFLQNVWVYDAGNSELSERPYFETTVSLASVSTIYSVISR